MPALPGRQFWRHFMAQRKQASFSELRVGILVLSAVAILILVIFAVSGDIKLPGFGKTATVKTQMASVDGLRKGAEVRLSGKKVGSVREINYGKIPNSPDSQSNIEIVMEIDGKLGETPAVERIRTDSMAVLKSAGVLGDNVIDITPGTSAGKPIQDGDSIPSVAQKRVGDIINAAQTAVGHLNVIAADIRELPGNMKSGKGTAGQFLDAESFYINLDSAVRHAESLMQEIKSGKGTMGQLVSDPAFYKQATDAITQLRNISAEVTKLLYDFRQNPRKYLSVKVTIF